MIISSTLYYWPIGTTVWLAYAKPVKARIAFVEARIIEDGEWLTYYVLIVDATHPLAGRLVPVAAKDCFATWQQAAKRAKLEVTEE